MVKRGVLNKVEKFYIEGNLNMPAEDIAVELDRSVASIQKYMDTIQPKKEAAPEPQVENKPKKKNTAFMNAVGTHERNGQKVATVMTRAASELADAGRPKNLMNKKLQEAIHKPRG